VQAFSREITRCLLNLGARLVVVACNTASAAALYSLRAAFPGIPFVGMDPAVKPAAEGTRSGVVGVLATPATFQSELYASVIERFAQGVRVLQDPCRGLVDQIESGDLTGPLTRTILETALRPMLAEGLDTVVLGCTHYPFVIPLIQQIAGPGVRVIDPAPAVARQAGRLLSVNGWVAIGKMPVPLRFITSGDPIRFSCLLPLLLGESGVAEPADWRGEELVGCVKSLPGDS
jgi:glutamate racemase